jgi:hypothetical protein
MDSGLAAASLRRPLNDTLAAVISVWPHDTLPANHPKTGGPEIP